MEVDRGSYLRNGFIVFYGAHCVASNAEKDLCKLLCLCCSVICIFEPTVELPKDAKMISLLLF